MSLVPLDDHRKDLLLTHLSNVTQAIVLGSLVTALAQGTLVGIAFALVGLPSAVVFAVLATLASIIPLVGTTIVWVPAALYLGLTGRWGASLFMVIWSVAVVSSADNVIRPLFISSRTKITTLPVFIGLLGGIGAFGAIGIFLGPVIIALVLALFEFAEAALAEQRAAESPATTQQAGATADGSRLWALGCRSLGGFWLLASGFWLLDSGFWILDSSPHVLPLRTARLPRPQPDDQGLESAVPAAVRGTGRARDGERDDRGAPAEAEAPLRVRADPPGA